LDIDSEKVIDYGDKLIFEYQSIEGHRLSNANQ